MKKNIIVLSAILAALPFITIGILPLTTTGCKTVPGGGTTFDLQRAAADLQLTANVGAYYLIKNKPDTRPVFQATVVALDMLISGPDADTNALQQAISNVVGTNQEVQFVVNTVVQLYLSDFGAAVSGNINSNQVVVTLLGAAKSGFEKALSQTSPTLRYTKNTSYSTAPAYGQRAHPW
jgi:hypothetical protein